MLWVFLILFLFLKQTQAQCPVNCQSCSTFKNCNVCQNGFFLVGGANCLPCPIGCIKCITNLANNQPQCTSCATHAKMGADGICYFCAPSCNTCSKSSNNCTSCQSRLVLKITNNTGQCIKDTSCDLQNCNECLNISNSYKYCSNCSKGYFVFRQGCFRCPYPCTNCSSQSLVTIWNNIISKFWPNILKQIYQTNNLIDLTWLTINNGNFQTMNSSLKAGWSQAYYLYKVLQPYILNLNIATSKQLITTSNALITQGLSNSQTLANIRTNLYININKIIGISWSKYQYETRIGVKAGQLTKCTECPTQGFYLNQNSSSCQICPPFCKNCRQGSCNICQSGRFLRNQTCTRCSSQCAQCDILSKNCTKCSPPFSLASNSCVLCNWPCQTCSATNLSLCYSCKSPFSLLASSLGSCYRCNQDKCRICSETNKAVCLQCLDGNSLMNGVCSACQLNCVSCSTIQSVVTCFQCSSGYILKNNSCLPCGPGCLSCLPSNINLCLTCKTKMYLSPSTGQCMLCPPECQQCVQGICTKLTTGTIYYGSVFIKCLIGCKRCNISSPDICLQCLQTFMLSNGVCQKCQYGCQKCISLTTCSRCLNHYNLSDGSCSPCLGYCLTCNSTNLSQCLSCKIGYSLSGTQCINTCGNGCIQCNPTNNIFCQICDFGYGLRSDGQCVKCLLNCTGRCDPYNITNCLTCADGYQNQNNLCVPCPLGCSTCINGQCTSCFHGYSLYQSSLNFICVDTCVYPCATCTASQCLTCYHGYILSKGTCVPDLQCNPNCLNCPLGTYLQNNICISCSNYCAACTNNSFCLACMEGYQITSNGKCISCPINCKTCSDGFCYLCTAPGYTRQVIAFNKGFSDAIYGYKCILCNDNCRRCQFSQKRCSTCDNTQQQLFGARCCNLYTVHYQYQTLTGYLTFLSDTRSEKFLSSISGMTGVPYQDNYFLYLKSGSTIFGGALSASNISEAKAIQGKLTSTISGQTIISSTSTIYYGETQYTVPSTQSGVGIGVIIGAAVGGCVLIIVIIVIVYCVIKRKNQQEQLKNKKQNVVPETNSQKQINEQWEMHI